MLSLIIFAFIAATIYMIPSWVGYKKENAFNIIMFNFFFGWTIIGWYLALKLALAAKPDLYIALRDQVDILTDKEKLLNSGTITKAEFDGYKAEARRKLNI